jgi:hypothetical protein
VIVFVGEENDVGFVGSGSGSGGNLNFGLSYQLSSLPTLPTWWGLGTTDHPRCHAILTRRCPLDRLIQIFRDLVSFRAWERWPRGEILEVPAVGKMMDFDF